MTKEELLKIIEKAAKDGRSSLDLSYRNISELPSEVANLTNLTELDLSDNQLSELPPEFTNLANLTSLDLSGNQLTELPPEVTNLANLTNLDLSGNQLTELPPEVTNLANLKCLYLSGNQLSELPPEVTRLTNLTLLNLSNNQLSEFPPEFANLTNLTYLDLSGNQLTELSPEVTNLTSLTSLYLSRNQLTELSQEVTNLTNLTSLDLSGNQLTELPLEVTNLTNLTSLDLSGNQLTELPPELTNLTDLKSLYLDEKQLRDWAEIVIRLKRVTLRILGENIYSPISPEIITAFKTGSELIAYYFKTEGCESRALNEAKIIIIGQGNAGKTSLRQRLTGESYEDKGRTEGVEIKRWETKALNKNTGAVETVKLNIWDFGGQEIYHTTHQFFFRARCVYLLVIDARADVSRGPIFYWLRQAQAFGRNAPVIVALNKAEEKNGGILDKRYWEGLETVLSLKEKFPDIFDCLLISCDKDLEIGKVKEAIGSAISEKLPEVFSPIPAKWFAVKESLEALNDNYLTETRFEELCAEIPAEERAQLTGILDALGIIVSFEDRDLSDTKVIKPEWITKGIYKILSSFVLGEENGRVLPEKIYRIFAGDGDYPADKVEYILRLMEKYDLCYIESKGGGERNLLFPVAFTVNEVTHAPLGENTTHFQYRYTNEYYDSIIVRFLKNAYQNFGPDFHYWRKGLIGRKDGYQIYVKADDVSNRIEIKIDGKSGGRRAGLDDIVTKIDSIHDRFEKLEVEKMLLHPEKAGIEFPYETVIKRAENGKDDIIYNDKEGAEIAVSLDYLLEGFAKKEIRREEDGAIAEASKHVSLDEINKCLAEKEALVRRKSALDTIGWILWIAILGGLLALAVWRARQAGDYSSTDFWTFASAVLAFVAIIPFALSFILNLAFGGNEETKKNFVLGFYRFPIRILQKGMYSLGGFNESKFEEVSKRLDRAARSSQLT